MPPDNAAFFGPWRVLDWPLSSHPNLSHIRVSHTTHAVDLIDLTSGPWVCAAYRFRDEHYYLDLTLEHHATHERIDGTFEMVRGLWRTPSLDGGHAPIDHHTFHLKYAGSVTVSPWPIDPFRSAHPPTAGDVLAPDGRFLVDLTTNRWKMSDWISPPRVIETRSGDALLDLRTTYWDARARFTAAHVVELTMAHYPAVNPRLTVELDLDAERYRITAGGTGIPRLGWIDELQAAIGRPESELRELRQRVSVRKSRREPIVPVTPTPTRTPTLTSIPASAPIRSTPPAPTPCQPPVPTPAPTPPTAATIPKQIERTIFSPDGAWKVDLYASGRSELWARGVMRPMYFMRLTRVVDRVVIADSRRTNHLVSLPTDDGLSMRLSASASDPEWFIIDLEACEFWSENYREPTSVVRPIQELGDALS